MAGFLIGVDVGTGSARAGVFDRDGALLAHAKRDIVIFRDDRGHVEQSSTQVWQAVCEAVSEAVASADDLSLRRCRQPCLRCRTSRCAASRARALSAGCTIIAIAHP